MISSFLALFIGFQSMIARYVLAPARTGVLPRKLGATSAEDGNPRTASVAVSATIAAMLLVFVVRGADPIAVTYAWLVGLGTVGLLVVLSPASSSFPSTKGSRWPGSSASSATAYIPNDSIVLFAHLGGHAKRTR